MVDACDGAEQLPCFPNSQAWVYFLTKSQALIFARKTAFCCPAEICRVQGQTGPNIVSNLIPLYHRHTFFLLNLQQTLPEVVQHVLSPQHPA